MSADVRAHAKLITAKRINTTLPVTHRQSTFGPLHYTRAFNLSEIPSRFALSPRERVNHARSSLPVGISVAVLRPELPPHSMCGCAFEGVKGDGQGGWATHPRRTSRAGSSQRCTCSPPGRRSSNQGSTAPRWQRFRPVVRARTAGEGRGAGWEEGHKLAIRARRVRAQNKRSGNWSGVAKKVDVMRQV
eukprot:6212273-Pleurochrysis_carterae.AAC.2